MYDATESTPAGNDVRTTAGKEKRTLTHGVPALSQVPNARESDCISYRRTGPRVSRLGEQPANTRTGMRMRNVRRPTMRQYTKITDGPQRHREARPPPAT